MLQFKTIIRNNYYSECFLQKLQLNDDSLTRHSGLYTAISRKVVGKSARDNPERHCRWFLLHCFSRKFERMAREAMDVCLHGLKESNKSRLNSYSVRNSVLIISHITFRDCRVHSFSDNLSRNNCMFHKVKPREQSTVLADDPV